MIGTVTILIRIPILILALVPVAIHIINERCTSYIRCAWRIVFTGSYHTALSAKVDALQLHISGRAWLRAIELLVAA